jgi:hypothetical protein
MGGKIQIESEVGKGSAFTRRAHRQRVERRTGSSQTSVTDYSAASIPHPNVLARDIKRDVSIILTACSVQRH